MIKKCEQCHREFSPDEQTRIMHEAFGSLQNVCDSCTRGKHKPINLRSVEQNRYYWGIIIRFIMKFKKWDDDKAAHEWIKTTWNIETTKDLSTGEYMSLLENVRNHVRKHWGLNIPEPNDDLEYLGTRFPWEELYFKYNEHLLESLH